MKYKSDDILYYTSPFVFTIEVVKIEIAYKEDDDTLFYISSEGSYLNEWDLFENFKEAQVDAMNKLNKFYHESRFNILNKSKPKLNKGL